MWSRIEGCGMFIEIVNSSWSKMKEMNLVAMIVHGVEFAHPNGEIYVAFKHFGQY